MSKLKIGMIGLDTSHCEGFVSLLNDSKQDYYVHGGEVVIGYPGGSPDFERSYGRVEGITETLKNNYGIKIVNSIEEVAEQTDAILLTTVDGRIHLEQFEKIVSYKKPVFIDKPFAVCTDHAKKMFELAKEYEVPLMSASSLRYLDNLQVMLSEKQGEAIIGADCFGPITLEPTQAGLYWYGIHSVEMLYLTMGQGCQHVTATSNEDYEYVVGVWKDGRIGTVRGNRKGNREFGAVIHGEKTSNFVNIRECEKPITASLMEEVMTFFKEKQASISPNETIEIIRFIEAANESRETGKTVML
ncbi:Gfo/Idh/MocA family protein [Pontibacillus sp. HMF3514]|uniref:Gfo/Idh/MocA family protein n=1 Tax=Pontibacillus sp. HMF3514 TaxID=2692425 RepID=UPI0013200FEF|nr:Gfo/Idh/MocA family oxidoreductase [Pontibacillus sp. HMF3514]QHE53035.1 Gfo/Idh/MocA family oxidoreductase [Pontibacillus sp. HMF3514]